MNRLTITLSVSVDALRGGVLAVQTCGPEVWHATVCVALGFYLALTSFAPEVSRFTESLFRLLYRNGRKKQDRFLLKITTTTCPAHTGARDTRKDLPMTNRSEEVVFYQQSPLPRAPQAATVDQYRRNHEQTPGAGER